MDATQTTMHLKVDHPYLHTTKKPHAAPWSYSGATGPANWGDLAKEYRVAKTGREQSPIDIRGAISTELPELELRYIKSNIHLVNNGHTIEQDEEEGSFAIALGDPYQLKQFHFHAPSEHTVDGKQFPMEMHLAHESPVDNRIAVVAVFIQFGEKNDAFDLISNTLPKAGEPQQDLSDEINALDLLPKDRKYYFYRGSFTTPPCTERVGWFVLKTPISMSIEQVQQFRNFIEVNNRPVQPLYGRNIFESESK